MQFLNKFDKVIVEYSDEVPVNYMNFLFSLEKWLQEQNLSNASEAIITSDWLYLYLADGNKPELRDMLLKHLPESVEKKVHLMKSECKYMDSEDWTLFCLRGLKGFRSV
jgi:hypothetical protein